VAAVALLGWSALAIRQRRLWPRQLQGRAGTRWLLCSGLALALYWLLRLLLSFGLGLHGFPAFPPPG
jgi:hypothetical protein